jgi:hypothetical protein
VRSRRCWPTGRATLEQEASHQGVDPSTAASIGADLGESASTIAAMLVNGLVKVVPVAASVVATVLPSFVVAFFFLKDGAVMWRWIVTNLGDFGELTDRTGRRVWVTLTGYIVGQTVIAAVDATLITLGAFVLGVPQLGAVFMLTLFGAYIPYIGTFLSGLVAVLLAIGDSGLDKRPRHARRGRRGASAGRQRPAAGDPGPSRPVASARDRLVRHGWSCAGRVPVTDRAFAVAALRSHQTEA